MLEIKRLEGISDFSPFLGKKISEEMDTGSWELNLQTESLYWSPGQFNLYGYQPSEFSIDKDFFLLKTTHFSDLKRITGIIDEALKDKNEYSFRRRIVKKHGQLGFIETNAKIIRSESGMPTKIIGISLDVAGRKDNGVFEYNDPEFFKVFYEKYRKSIAYAIYNFVFDSELAQDLCQEIFLKAWNNMSRYNPEKGEIYTWLINITRNHCKDYLKTRHAILNKDSISLDHAFNLMDDVCDVTRMEVKNLVTQLPIENQELIDLLFIQGFTQQEVAHLKNIPLGSVKTKSRRTIGMLRKLSGINTESHN